MAGTIRVVTYVLVGVVAAGAGFGGGYLFRNYQLGQTRSQFARQFGVGAGTSTAFGGRTGAGGSNAPRTSAGQMMRFGGRPISGSIVSADTNSLTIKMADGSSRIVLLSGTTKITTATVISQSQLTQGATVTILGTDNSDGSVSAESVQLMPTQATTPGTTASPAPTQ